jgi:hypothetical protein
VDKYLLVLRGGNNMWDQFSPEDIQKLTERYFAWTDALIKSGKFVGAEELTQDGRVVRDESGTLTDGPYVETKDAIGGYYLIQAADYDEAVAVAKESPIFTHGGYVEVRRLNVRER